MIRPGPFQGFSAPLHPRIDFLKLTEPPPTGARMLADPVHQSQPLTSHEMDSTPSKNQLTTSEVASWFRKPEGTRKNTRNGLNDSETTADYDHFMLTDANCQNPGPNPYGLVCKPLSEGFSR